MNEEMSARLAQELLDAADDDARARVVVHWLPDFARCQVATAGRVKQLVAAVDNLGKKMDAYHGAGAAKAKSAPSSTSAEETRPRDFIARLTAFLGLLKANWQWVAILLLLLKAYGLTDLFERLFALMGGAP